MTMEEQQTVSMNEARKWATGELGSIDARPVFACRTEDPLVHLPSYKDAERLLCNDPGKIRMETSLTSGSQV